MSRPVTTTDDEISQALQASGGVLATAAIAIGMSRQGLWKRVKGNAALEEARDTAKAELLDVAESGLFKAVRAGKPWAIRFVLSRLGRGRGYGATLQLDAQPMGKICVYLPDDGRELPEEEIVAVEPKRGEDCDDEKADGRDYSDGV